MEELHPHGREERDIEDARGELNGGHGDDPGGGAAMKRAGSRPELPDSKVGEEQPTENREDRVSETQPQQRGRGG